MTIEIGKDEDYLCTRAILKNSSLDFFPSLIKEKQFNDTVEDVTFFVEKKSADGSFENIFIRDW